SDLAHGPELISRLAELALPPGTLLNVNFPACAPEAVDGVAVTVQGKRPPELLRIDARVDGRGNPYFWIAFGRGRAEPEPGTDLRAIAENRISVTPLQLNLTDLVAHKQLLEAMG